jgi:subtilisin family serine protease
MSVHKYIEKPGKYFRKKPAVKIAVLDTGIDPEHAFINGAMKAKRIVVAESFVNGDRSIDDRFGHGTHVANLLLSVAPDTELYVAKVANSEEIPPDHNINKVRKMKQSFIWAEE